MRTSRYTILHQEDGKYYVFHQVSKTLLEVDKNLYNALSENKTKDIPMEIAITLSNRGILVSNDFDESSVVQYWNIAQRYQSRLLRITIIPTIDCNFRCWYCYEKHHPSRITTSDMDSIFEFIKERVKEKLIKEISLDWFGGEPLLCFNNIIYPFTLKVQAWAKDNGVILSNMITTNGSLINEKMVGRMNEICLNQFQITIDGGKKEHNKTRFSSKIPNSFDVIVNNIHSLCKSINSISVDLRINYTEANINSVEEILYCFDESIRHLITISPHIVWQESGKFKRLIGRVENLRNIAIGMGFHVHNYANSSKCVSCYTEYCEQYVINYDLSVYKCTARDFDKKFSIGTIKENGKFIPSPLFYKYYATPSPFMNKRCLNCELLPSCYHSNSCIQKIIEGNKETCHKSLIMKELIRYINDQIRIK